MTHNFILKKSIKKYMQICLLPLIFFGCAAREDFPYPYFFWGFALEGFPITEQDLDSLQKETQVVPEMILFYLQWPVDATSHQSLTPTLEAIWKAGAIPCLTWEPMYIDNQIKTTIPYEDVLNGLYDPYLSVIANDIKQWGKPLVIRFAHEMNLATYHWGTSLEDYGPHSPEIYIKMFRHVVEIFRSKQATNALWAFCPNADSVPNEDWNEPQHYYPGDQYVDLLGMDGYNWGASSEEMLQNKVWFNSGRSFEEIFHSLYHQLKKIAPHKPIIVFETASVKEPNGKNQSQWIQEALKISKKWGIKGIVWFQANKEKDWRLKSTEDPSYIPLINPAQPSLQMWLLNRH